MLNFYQINKNDEIRTRDHVVIKALIPCQRTNVMFVSRDSLSGKPLSKLSCVCLPLEKLVNGKHFPVNEEHFPVNGEHFPVNGKTLSGQRKTLSSQRKIWFSFQESVFLLAVFVFRKVVSEKPFSKLSCVCLPLEKLVNGKHFPVKGKFSLVFRKVFSWKIWAENTFRKL
jgi:hypothetical protein